MKEMKNDKIILFDNKNNCCGCGACYDVCPQRAISMIEDEYGFVYPKINAEKCTKCGACKNVCGYQNEINTNEVLVVYAAANGNDKTLKESSSGGIFAICAEKIIRDDGVVYGAGFITRDKKLYLKHIRITKISEIHILQGSKYVQSDTTDSFKQVKQDLLNDIKVLYTGTPCQIASLKKYLGKEYANLFTIDIICHGVPSIRMFQDFIMNIGKQNVIDYKFRGKKRGQGFGTELTFKKNKKLCKIQKDGRTVSYVSLFLKSLIYRENCYRCLFAKRERVSDITLGDYWGAYTEHPDIYQKTGMSEQKGISCLLINTKKGMKIFEQFKENIVIMETTLDKVARNNMQLVRPSQYNDQRDIILQAYKEKGYGAVEKYYSHHYTKEKIKVTISGFIPITLKSKIKDLKRKKEE